MPDWQGLLCSWWIGQPSSGGNYGLQLLHSKDSRNLSGRFPHRGPGCRPSGLNFRPLHSRETGCGGVPTVPIRAALQPHSAQARCRKWQFPCQHVPTGATHRD